MQVYTRALCKLDFVHSHCEHCRTDRITMFEILMFCYLLYFGKTRNVLVST